MQSIKINASREYLVQISNDFSGLKSVVKSIAKGNKIAVITDENVAPLYLEQVISLINKDFSVLPIVLKAGEKTKSIQVYANLLNTLAENSFNRQDALIALGGGVIGDLVAFTASTYMRGISFIAVPTTLISMIDSSVGGKTAININTGKNLCGTFYQPYAVYVNVDTLKTLPTKEILCGKGEMVKYAVLDNAITKEDLDNYQSQEVIKKCIQIKKHIVEQDEFESGKRALLNLGHTFGHAVEALSNYTVSHGECVLYGLYIIATLSKNLGKLSSADYEQVNLLLNKVGVKKDYGYAIEQMLTQIKVDKKSNKNGINLAVINKIGSCEIVKLPIEEIRSYLE